MSESIYYQNKCSAHKIVKNTIPNNQSENSKFKTTSEIDKNSHKLAVNNKSWTKYICHQRPDRCFIINGKPMPLCARCIGVYSGLTVGLVIPIIIPIIYSIDVNILFFILIISLTPLALDGVTQLIKIRESNNYLRFFTGFLAGMFLGIVFNWLTYHALFL